jgi:hypothetical protein
MKHEIVCRAFNTERLHDFDVAALPDGASAAYLYYGDEPGRRSVAELPTRGGGHATDSVRNCLRQERNAR